MVLKINMDELVIEKDHSTTTRTGDDVLHKADLMRLNNGWNDKNERIVISVGENAASYKWMHEKCANYHKFIHKFISILLIVLSTGLTAETIYPDPNGDFVIDIVRRTLVYVVNVLTVLQTFFRSEEVGEKHLVAGGGYSTLYHDIQQQMCMFRRDRVNATKYVSECLKQYDSLVITSPDISSRVLMKFKNTFKNSDIALPEIADKIQKIEIIIEDPMQSNLNGGPGGGSPGGSSPGGGSPGGGSPGGDSDIVEKEFSSFNLQKRIKRKGVPLVLTNKQSSVQNCNNLAQIHNAFQIHGDISDKDLENIDSIQLRELRNRFLQEKSDYEYQRFLQHSHEDE